MSSEVARILKNIEQEYQASKSALEGLSSGSARHDFISKRSENIAKQHETLSQIVGPEKAIALIANTIWTPTEQAAASLPNAQAP
jgi:F0F1-type ATP synthase gamma subunit